MKRYRLPAAIALACAVALLPACAALTKLETGHVQNISPSTVLTMRSAYDAAVLVPLATYRRLPWCSAAPAPCQTGAIARKLVTANAAALKALDDLQTFAKAHPTLDATALIIAAQLAIGNAENLATTYGVLKS